MTAAQQKIVDGFHQKAIQLIYKRRAVARYGGNWAEEDKINQEILKIEDERRTYERDCREQRQEKSEISRSIPSGEAGPECRAEANVGSGQQDLETR